MKILYLSTDPMMHPSHQAGYATHIRKVIEGLTARGHEVYPCIAGIPRSGGEDKQLQSVNKWKQILRGIIPQTLWEGLKDLRLIRHDRAFYHTVLKTVKNFSPDIIYERQAYLHKCGAKVAKITGVPLVVETNNPQAEERSTLAGFSPLYRQAMTGEKQVLNNAAQVVVVSTALKQYLIEKLQIPDEKIRVIPNAVDPKRFNQDKVDGLSIRERYDLAKYPVVGFVGSFFRWHGLDQLLIAVAKIKDSVPQFRVLLVGDGSIRLELEQQVQKLNLKEQVIFTGSISPTIVPQYIAAMDICLQANTNWYMSPIKLFEYGAMGKPIIAPKTKPVGEVLKDEEEGLLVQGPEELMVALHRFLTDPEFATSCGEHFQKRVLSEYTWSHVAQKLETGFTEVLAQRDINN